MYEVITVILIIPPAITLVLTLSLLGLHCFNRSAPKMVKELPTTSILLPFYNEEMDVLEQVLAKLELQRYSHPLQIVLIDDGSTNQTPELLKKWLTEPRKQNYQLLTRKKNGGCKGQALDYALNSNLDLGQVYVVVDSDTFVAPNGIAQLVSKLWENPQCAAVCGSLAPQNVQRTLLDKIQFYELIGFHTAIRSAQDSLGYVPILSGAFVAHRASAVMVVGGWSSWLVEDISWCWKALAMGYQTGYAANALATTNCPQTMAAFFRQRRRWARGRIEAYMTTWHISVCRGICFTPWFLITSVQLLFPPGLIMIPLLLYFQFWIPVILSAFTIMLYLAITWIFVTFHQNRQNISLNNILLAPFYILSLEILVWIPNVLGYIDELTRKKKNWLTR